MPYEFYLGIDAHATGDEASYAAALIEKSAERASRKAAQRDAEPPEEVQYRAHVLNRYRDTPIDAVVDAVVDDMAGEPFAGRTSLVVNVAESAGRDLLEALRERGTSPITIAVGGGETSSEQGRPLSFSASANDAVHVSEREIVSTLAAIHRDGRLELDIVKEAAASALVRGLEAYQVESDVEDVQEDIDVEELDEAEANAPSSSDLRQRSDEADYVLAAASACWLASQHSFDPTDHLDEPPPPVREAKRTMRPDTAKPRTPTR